MANETLGASFKLDITALKAGLTQANRLIRESESEFRAAAAGMDDWTKSQEGLEARSKTLNKQIELQTSKIDGLVEEKERIVEAMKKEGKSSDEIAKATDEVNKMITKEAKELDKLKNELNKTETASEKLANETDDLGDKAKKSSKEVEDLGDKAEDTGDGFTVAKGAVANFIADGLSAMAGAIKDAIGNLLGLAEATREYREDLGKLNTAFETAGLSTELATKTYKDLYSVLGEEDRTIEAVNHLAKFVKTEEDMAEWTNTLTGIWGMFGDSLPIEGLTEATNESIRNGQVTGVLADAINWAAKSGETFGVKLKANTDANEEWNKAVQDATTAEEFFNLALQECSTEQERQELITKTLNGLYAESATNYKKNNESIIESRKATSDYTDKVAELGEKVEPITTKVQQGFNKVLDVVLELVDDVDFDKLGKKIDKAFKTLTKKIIPAIMDGFQWVIDNWKTIQAGILGAFSAFLTTKLVLGIASATTAFKTLFATIKAFTMTNPIGLIATAVGLLVGGIVALSSATDSYTDAQKRELKAAKESAEEMRDKAEAYREAKKAVEEQTGAELAELGQVQALNRELGLLVDEKGRVAEKDEARVQFILNELNNALGTEYSLTGNIIKNYQDLQKEIDTLIEKKQAEIWLNDALAKYEEAVLNQESARNDVTKTRIERDDQKNVLTERQNELLEKQAELEEYLASVDEHYQDNGYVYLLKEQISELQDEIIPYEEGLLADRETAYEQASNTMLGYLEDIKRYEEGQTLVLEGESKKAIEYLSQTSEAVKEQQKAYEDGARGQAQALRDSMNEAEAWAKFVKEQYEKGVAGVSKEAVEEAEAAAKRAKHQWETVGKSMIKGTVSGVEGSYSLLEQSVLSSVNKVVNKAIAEADAKIRNYKPTISLPDVTGGSGTPKMATGGIVRGATHAIIGEAGAEAVLPLERNTGWADILADKLASRMGNAKGGSVVVNQTNNYSQQHSRYEIYKSNQDTARAVKLALKGAY